LVIGAGPYGVATAARAMDQGIDTVVFGRPMSFWTDHMPADATAIVVEVADDRGADTTGNEVTGGGVASLVVAAELVAWAMVGYADHASVTTSPTRKHARRGVIA
jgi:hypothetical protein